MAIILLDLLNRFGTPKARSAVEQYDREFDELVSKDLGRGYNQTGLSWLRTFLNRSLAGKEPRYRFYPGVDSAL